MAHDNTRKSTAVPAAGTPGLRMQPLMRNDRVSTATEALPLTVIRSSRGRVPLNLRELWQYRELLYFLVWKEVKVRYKQTVLGVGWAVLQPVFMMIVFTLFFGTLAGISSGGVPYPIFAYAALLPWNLFARGLSDASTSVAGNQNLITKVYFPRVFLPTSSVMAGLIDFGIAFIVLVGLMMYYGIVPTLAVLTLPIFILFAVMGALGIGFWFSAVDARFRDVRYTLPFLTQLWLFATPVVYPASLVPESWRWLYSLNPMVGVIEGFRWALLGEGFSLDLSAIVSYAAVLAIFVGGLFYFKRIERTLADLV